MYFNKQSRVFSKHILLALKLVVVKVFWTRIVHSIKVLYIRNKCNVMDTAGDTV